MTIVSYGITHGLPSTDAGQFLQHAEIILRNQGRLAIFLQLVTTISMDAALLAKLFPDSIVLGHLTMGPITAVPFVATAEWWQVRPVMTLLIKLLLTWLLTVILVALVILLAIIALEEVHLQLRLVLLCAEMENEFLPKLVMIMMLMAPPNVNRIAWVL